MRNQRRDEKMSLSPEWERAIFRKPLKKREIEALRLRCESYQEASVRPWSADIYPAYAQYFGILSALKVKSVLQELDRYGYLDVWGNQPVRIFDYGAGTLGGTTGAIDFLRASKNSIEQLSAYDQDRRPVDWAQQEFSNLLENPVHFGRPTNFEQTLIIAVDVFNECAFSQANEIEQWIDRATDSTIIVLLEPAAKAINQKFLELRNLLSKKINILLPCTHSFDCPALKDGEWCHEDRPYKAPSAYWNLVKQMGFRKSLLQFSMLCLGKQPSRFSAAHARMVSRPLKNKGRSDKWLCGNGRRWKQSIMLRHKNETNEAYFEAARGDVIDCHSTGLIVPA
jgi:hypothetical protein